MNEKFKKAVVVSAFLCLIFAIVILSITDNIAFRRADTTIDSLERQLFEARAGIEKSTRELEDSRRTLEQCHNSVGRIADDIGRNGAELSDIIANLKTVREEIENMENALDFFYIKYGHSDNNNYDNGSDVE